MIEVRDATLADCAQMGRLMVDTWPRAHRHQMPRHLWEARRRDWTPDFSERGWHRTIEAITDGAKPDDVGLTAEILMRIPRDRLLGQIQAGEQSNVTDLLPRITVPTLVISTGGVRGMNTRDEVQAVASKIPGAKLRVGKDRDEAAPEALKFIAGTERTAPAIRQSFQTIMFTGVVSSTPLLAQLRDAKMREVIREHDEMLEAAVTGHGGRVIKTIGDAFMTEFAVPSNAVDAAVAAQRTLRERFAESDMPICIRIGINAGEPIEEDGDINGILVSDVVKQAVAGKDFDFEDRGMLELKGFEEPVRAWAVRWE